MNPTAIVALSTQPTDVSPLLRSITTPSNEPNQDFPPTTNNENVINNPTNIHSSSFIYTLPNTHTELEQVSSYLHMPHPNPNHSLQWPTIGLTPINEYTTEGLLSMYFPTLFPTGSTMLNQPRIQNVDLQEYALHLMRYYDNRFA